MMFEKLDRLKERYEELAQLLADPRVIADQERWRQYVKEHAELSDIVSKYTEYQELENEMDEAKELLRDSSDQEFRSFVEGELNGLRVRHERVRQELKRLLAPKDPNDEKNVIVEIRAGTGGDEASLFAGDLFRMYSRYAEVKGYKVEILNSHPTDIGGFREIIFGVEGKGAYSRLKYESGVHRVQRVPATESQGRIHTSAATVAVLPEAEEVEVEVDPSDLRIDTYCSSGPGGQSVNTTYSAVRITHLPTGLVVTCQDEKSQHKNKEKAMRVLRARLLDMMEKERHAEEAELRRAQVGTGDRSERIRTYNFPQNRVTDHRIGLTLHKLDRVLDGELDEIIDQLITTDRAQNLENMD